MAENPYVNKVQKADGSVIMDISNDTATPSDVLNGATFHDRSGAPQTGSVITHNVYDGLDSTSTNDALSANQGKILKDKLSSFAILNQVISGIATIPANGTKEFTVQPNAITGYSFVGVIKAVCPNSNCFVYNFYGSSTSVIVNVRNISGSDITNGAVAVASLYIKN